MFEAPRRDYQVWVSIFLQLDGEVVRGDAGGGAACIGPTCSSSSDAGAVELAQGAFAFVIDFDQLAHRAIASEGHDPTVGGRL